MAADRELIGARPRQSEAEIRRQLEKARQQIQSSAAALREEVVEATEWRSWYRRDPAVWMGAAFVFGLYLGIRSSNR